MNELRTKLMDIAASLYISPATIEELNKRDFLINTPEYGLIVLLRMLNTKKWIYKKGDVYSTYKATVTDVLNKNGYQL